MLTVDSARAYLNGTPLSSDSLFTVLYGLSKRYAPGFVVNYVPKENISYERYIKYLDLVYQVTDRLRNEASYAIYDYPIDCWQYPEDCAALEKKVPAQRRRVGS